MIKPKFTLDNKNERLFIILLFVPIVVQLFLSSLSLNQRFKFVLYSVLFLLLSFGGTYLVLRVRVLLSKKWLNNICGFFIISAFIFLFLLFIVYIHHIDTSGDAIAVSFSYIAFGIILASYRIKNKYIVE
jgi:hypothetical protein